MIPPKFCDVYEHNKKIIGSIAQKFGVMSPNSKLLPNGGSGQKADFQENSCRRRKFVIARSFLDQSTWFFLQMIGKDSTYMIHDHFWVNLLILG